MTKAAKKPDSRAKALAGMTKAELVRTVKQLDKRQTTLLNEIAALKTQVAQNGVAAAAMAEEHIERDFAADVEPNPGPRTAEQEERRRVFGPFPWETKPEGE